MLPELRDFEADAKFMMNPGPQNNYSVIFPTSQKASDFLWALRNMDPDQLLWHDPIAKDRRPHQV